MLFTEDGTYREQPFQLAFSGRAAIQDYWRTVTASQTKVRVCAIEHRVVGVLGPRASLGGFNTDANDFVVIPQTTRQTLFGTHLRIRHGLLLDEPNDFDLITKKRRAVWEQVSQATFLALVVISSIALRVGGICVVAIMTISVTEWAREIGLRKARGARRREILTQFLARLRLRPARNESRLAPPR